MTDQSSTLLNYEPHTNLSINVKTPHNCHNLFDIRYEIDTIDHFIVKLMHHRMQYVLAASKFKPNVEAIRDTERVNQQLNQRKKWAEEYGLDPKFIEFFFKQMIDWYISQQISYYKSQHSKQMTIENKYFSANELRAAEFDLNWINISHYSELLRRGYTKAQKIREPVLVSFTQKIPAVSNAHNLLNVHAFSLFESARHLSLSNGFLFIQPSRKSFMLAFGNVQQFSVNQNIFPSDNMGKQIADLTYEEFNLEVNKVVGGGWQILLQNAVIENCAQNDLSSYGPVLTGGLCFDHKNTCRSDKWSDFGEASFVLSQIQFTGNDVNKYATFNTVITKYDEIENEINFINSEIFSLIEFCAVLLNATKQYTEDMAHTESFDETNRTKLTLESVISPEIWKRTVHDAIVKITNGDFEKVVLAREVQVKNDQQTIFYNVGRSLKRLSSLYPSSYLFGVLRKESCFFGATPEQLVRLESDEVQSTALAGTIRRSSNDIEDKILETELLNSKKQRHEHNLVVEMIKRKLELMTESKSLVASNEPVILKLVNLQHLHTQIQGKIRKGITILDLVQTLHPTPAVGGFPQFDAMKFIRENENLDRGWYAAPIGWIDMNNSGEFAVALRSALINGRLISIFAGCGIVAGSDPDDEFNETKLKMKTMLSALSDK